MDGEIKAWFDKLKYAVASPDGTYGVPADYTNCITMMIEGNPGYIPASALERVKLWDSCNDAWANLPLYFGQDLTTCGKLTLARVEKMFRVQIVDRLEKAARAQR